LTVAVACVVDAPFARIELGTRSTVTVVATGAVCVSVAWHGQFVIPGDVGSVAVIVAEAADDVLVTVVEYCPLALVVPVAVPKCTLASVLENVTLSPTTGASATSVTVAVTVELSIPSVTTEVGDTITVMLVPVAIASLAPVNSPRFMTTTITATGARPASSRQRDLLRGAPRCGLDRTFPRRCGSADPGATGRLEPSPFGAPDGQCHLPGGRVA
jgi:hypothetical protein